jgi:4-hydroxyphenylpyruvate dioxygenase
MTDTYFSSGYHIDYIEIYTPMAKALAYWHAHALGFTVTAYANFETGRPDISSYVLGSGGIQLVLSATYPTATLTPNLEVASFIANNYCGVKRIALQTNEVDEVFAASVAKGAIPVKFPAITEDNQGYVKEAAIRLYDHSEITFTDRTHYSGAFKPGYKAFAKNSFVKAASPLLSAVDHIASEVRINEVDHWTRYLTATIGTELVQSIQRGGENKTGMIMNINQSFDGKLTLVIAEPETYLQASKVQQNIDKFGPGIHHLAFSTDNLPETVEILREKGVEFVGFPPSYYELLRKNKDFQDIDIDSLERNGILIDKEGDSYLLQKFIKPISDRPFFLYELVQRHNGYTGFALKNINTLKKAEELDIMKTS